MISSCAEKADESNRTVQAEHRIYGPKVNAAAMQ